MPLGNAVMQKYGDETAPGLAWIDGINRHGDTWAFESLCARPNGHSFETMPLSAGMALPLADTKCGWFLRAPTITRKVDISDLSRAETVFDPADVLRGLIPGIQPSKRHSLFQVSAPDRVYVPALLLIRALFGGSRVLDQHLLVPNAVDLLGVGKISQEAVEVTPSEGIGSGHGAGRLSRLLAWATTCPDARRSHASVLNAARRGEIALSLPKVEISCWARGYELDTGFLAIDLSAIDIKLPLAREEIVVHLRGKTKRFPSYVAQAKSPWSRSYRAAAGQI